MAGMFFLMVLLMFAIVIFGMFAMAEGHRMPWNSQRSRRKRAASGWEQSRSRGAAPQAAQIERRQREFTSRRSPRVTPTAQAAMHRAGYDAGPDYAQISDVGLLAYRTESEPRLVRMGDVMTDAKFLRPYAELWVPFRSRGPVRFELVDANGRVRYADEERYDLDTGRNPLLPGTWLPLSGKWVEPGQKWQLRVSAGQTVLAVHNFGWQSLDGGDLKPFIESDGEISPELQAMLQDSSSQALSLSDLLNGQADR